MGDFTGKTVLVAEDDAFLNKVYGVALKKEGFKVVFVKNGLEVMDAVSKQVPDLILLDLVMPTLDGFAVLEKLRAAPVTAKVRVIVLSNLGQDSDMEAVKKFGVEDYIIKSNTHIKEIVEKIKSALSQDSPDGAPAAPAAAPVAAPEQPAQEAPATTETTPPATGSGSSSV